jgi:hypothetical protein
MAPIRFSDARATYGGQGGVAGPRPSTSYPRLTPRNVQAANPSGSQSYGLLSRWTGGAPAAPSAPAAPPPSMRAQAPRPTAPARPAPARPAPSTGVRSPNQAGTATTLTPPNTWRGGARWQTINTTLNSIGENSQAGRSNMAAVMGATGGAGVQMSKSVWKSKTRSEKDALVAAIRPTENSPLAPKPYTKSPQQPSSPAAVRPQTPGPRVPGPVPFTSPNSFAGAQTRAFSSPSYPGMGTGYKVGIPNSTPGYPVTWPRNAGR